MNNPSTTTSSATEAPTGQVALFFTLADIVTSQPTATVELGVSTRGPGEVANDIDSRQPTERPSDSSLYPHLFDAAQPPGQVLNFLKVALEDARGALDSFDDANFADLSSRLTYVAATMGQAFPLTTFNEDFGIVVAYIRRATLAADVTIMERGALNALITVLRTLSISPAIGLDEAGALVDQLRNEGWDGRHTGAAAILAELFPDHHSTNVSDERVDAVAALLALLTK